MLEAVSVLRLLFYFFQKTYVGEINLLEASEIKKMNDDGNRNRRKREQELRIDEIQGVGFSSLLELFNYSPYDLFFPGLPFFSFHIIDDDSLVGRLRVKEFQDVSCR